MRACCQRFWVPNAGMTMQVVISTAHAAATQAAHATRRAPPLQSPAENPDLYLSKAAWYDQRVSLDLAETVPAALGAAERELVELLW
ncbi:hypothetical protein MY4038_008774 [Beauveria bassiana]